MCGVCEDSIVSKNSQNVAENILTLNNYVRAHYNKKVSIVRKFIETVSSITRLVTQS